MNLEPTQPNSLVGCKVPTDLEKISVKEAMHMGFYYRPRHKKLFDVISDHHPTQMQWEPTRLGNVLDIYCTNKPRLMKYYATIPGSSNHEAIIVDSDLRPEFTKKTPRKVYSYSKADWTSIRQEMNDFAGGYIESLPSLSVEEGWSVFKLQSTVNKHIP